jgi:tRNA dimethylallyltransferase
VRALLDRIELPGTDPAVRAAWEARAGAALPGELHAVLAQLDPEAAKRILPGNTRRIVRALEVIELTGRPFTATLPQHEYALPAVQIGLDGPSDAIDRAIDGRAERMVAGGLIEEVESLAQDGLREGRTASRAIGYAQGLAVLEGRMTRTEASAAIALATRQLARRQRKWFRRDPRVTWIEAGPGAAVRALAAIARLA